YQALGPGQVVAYDEGVVRLRSGTSTVEVTALAPDVFRVGLFGEGRGVDYRSEAIARSDWPSVATRFRQTESHASLSAGDCVAEIGLDPLRIGFRVGERQFAVDEASLGMGFLPLAEPSARLVDPLGAPAMVFKRHEPDTRYFGCGERTGGLEKTGTRQVFWNVDPPAGHTAALNNLYTSVPFVLALRDGQAWGLFVDSSYRLEFDLAAQDPERCAFGVDGGPLVYYVFSGPSPRQVLERYTELTGRIPMPPRWALGYHQSRWGYTTADEVLRLARTFRERNLPLDAVYLDIDYMRGYRVFTWDPERFADPAALVRELAELGVKLVTIVDPGVKVDHDYPVYTSAREADLFCKTFSGAEYHNVVWPGTCAFPDFTNPRTRDWWAAQLPSLLEPGVAGIWCDMNEPTMFVPTPHTLPDDVAHHGDGEAVLHAQVHNLYGQLMARATYEGLRHLQPDRRPFVISRAGFAGLQRYALHWTGDNDSWWEHLWMSMPQLQNLGLSGYAWVGVDVGGFSGDATGELLARWTEFGIFQPFCRNHSAWGTHPQEPWAFGETYEAYIRTLLRLRQRLLPYLYTLFEEAHRSGAPILRPLLFEYPDDPTTCSTDDEFLLGSALLVAPMTRPGNEYRHVYLPQGTWVHYWTGRQSVGPVHILAHAPLGQPAVYVRANTPVPLWPDTAYAGDALPDPLTWLVCVALDSADGAGEYYADAGEGFAFLDGDFVRTRAVCRVNSDSVDLELSDQGDGTQRHARVHFDIRGVARPTEVLLDGAPTDDWEHSADWLLVRLDGRRRVHRVHVAAAPTMTAV
ncbi:MAG: alpha-glucosidase, partial [Chloroflexi bacterium]|nr:alpha-glucosidase [Chloroflexota bacterium]